MKTILVDKVSKIYKLYNNPRDRMFEALNPFRKIYHTNFYALNDVTLSINKGEVLGIIGKNGSGKSTLLKLICGILSPTKGNIIVDGAISALIELGAGFNPEYSGIENVYFYGSILGYSKETMKQKLPSILDFADIGDFIYQPVKQYSSGMKARLSFSVAVNIDPQILIVDEVLAVGDELFRRKCFSKIQSFVKKGVTILLVTHSINTINELCSRAILIDQGEIILDGPPKFVTSNYQ